MKELEKGMERTIECGNILKHCLNSGWNFFFVFRNRNFKILIEKCLFFLLTFGVR